MCALECWAVDVCFDADAVKSVGVLLFIDALGFALVALPLSSLRVPGGTRELDISRAFQRLVARG